jgi:hypothetical protein
MSKPPRTFRQAFPIVQYVILNPGRTAHAIEVKTGIERHTVLDALKLLTKARFVNVTQGDKLPTGLISKKYRATPQGLIGLLQGHPDHIKLTKQNVRDLAKPQISLLPLIFGKWDYFRENGAEDLAYRLLLHASKNVTPDQIERLEEAARTDDILELSLYDSASFLRHSVYAGMLAMLWPELHNEETLWLQSIRDNPEIVTMAEKEISRMQARSKSQVLLWDAILAIIQGRDPGVFGMIRYPRAAMRLVIEYWDYLQTKALDASTVPPTLEEILRKGIEKLPREINRASRRLNQPQEI